MLLVSNFFFFFLSSVGYLITYMVLTVFACAIYRWPDAATLWLQDIGALGGFPKKKKHGGLEL